MLKDETEGVSGLDYRLLEDPRMAKQALRMIIETKEGLDNFVDMLELLSDPKFRKKLGQGLKESREGKAVRLSIAELRQRFK